MKKQRGRSTPHCNSTSPAIQRGSDLRPIDFQWVCTRFNLEQTQLNCAILLQQLVGFSPPIKSFWHTGRTEGIFWRKHRSYQPGNCNKSTSINSRWATQYYCLAALQCRSSGGIAVAGFWRIHNKFNNGSGFLAKLYLEDVWPSDSGCAIITSISITLSV